MTERLSEHQLSKIWLSQSLDKTALTTEDGDRIEIIYPGRINDARGADFRDAVIATGRGLLKGDVELHVRTAGWFQHHHHLNCDYNRVILHVVMWHDGRTVTNLESGRIAPILELAKYINNSAGQLSASKVYPAAGESGRCQSGRCISIKSAGNFLDQAGEERFLEKAARYRNQLTHTESMQVLYQGIMEALGYSRNKLCFQTLAQRLPFRKLEEIAQKICGEDECLARQQALLLGTAGLLPSQRGINNRECFPAEEWGAKLEEIWENYYHQKSKDIMSYQDWQFFKIRPSNSPIRRLAAITYLVLRYRRKGILDSVMAAIAETSGNTTHQLLEGTLLVKGNNYWADHYDFGQTWRSGSPTLLGQGLARTITTNILLPFSFAWGEFTSDQRLSSKALELFQHYPRLPLNTIDRHMMGQMRLVNSMVDSARRQQGLLHIYRNFCSQGQCYACHLKQSQSQ